MVGFHTFAGKLSLLYGLPLLSVYRAASLAATKGMLDAVENGATDEQALTMGLLNGAAEIVFENISLKSLLNGPADSLIKTILNQGFEEGREELLTSLANNLADAVIMAEKSGYTRKVEQYKAQGLTEGQAVAKALTDMAIDMGWDFVGGMFTGGIMGGGSYAGGKAGQAVSNKLYQLAEKMYSGSDTTLGEGERIATSPTAPRNDRLETENTAQVDGVRYSIRNTSQMSLKEQLSKFYGNKLKSSDAFYLGETPAVLEKAGAKAAPLVMTTSSFKKSVTDKHNIPRRVINKLSENLQKPILSFGVNGEAGVLIDDIDGDGKPVLVAIHADQIMDNEKVNNVKSIYGLDNPVAWIQNQIDSGKHLEVYDEEKANAFLRSYGYQALQEDGVRSVTRIADPGANVKQNPSTSAGKVLLQGNQGHTFEVELGRVASAGDGKLVMNLQGGGSAEISNMSFPNAGEQELYRAVAKIADSTETAQQMLDGYFGERIATSPAAPRNDSVSAQMYANATQQVYLYGKLQMPLEEAVRSSNAVKQLSPELRSSIYEMGQRAGQKQAAKAQQSAAEKNAGKERKGGVHYGYNGQAIDKKKLSPAQRVAVDFAERLAKRKGMTFYFYRSWVNEKGVRVYRDRSGKIVEADNGFYDPSDGSIHIDLNCDNFGDTILFTLAHELTHFIQDTNPEGYRRLCEILTRGYMGMNQSMDLLVKNKQEDYRRKGKDLSYEEAYDEVIAASMESILADGRVLELLDELETKDKSLREQIRSFIEDTARLLKEIIDAYRGKRPTSPEGRIVMRMNTLYEQLQEAFAQSLHEGGENYRQGGQTNTSPEGGTKSSIVVLDNGNVYVKASRNVITGNSLAEQRRNITDFFNNLLEGNPSLDIPTLEGDVLTITKRETAAKARDDFKTVNGTPVRMSNDEFAVKLRIEAHIDEVAEVARGKQSKGDGKNHSFAKDGFTYRRAYFEDFDGQYYEVTLSIGNNGTVATVYNVGKIKESVLPSAKILAVVGSKPLSKTLSKSSIRNFDDSVKKNSIRYQVNQAAQEHLQEQNAGMAEDVVRLNDLVAAQRRANGGRMKAEALDAAASHLMKTAGAKGNKTKLARLLNTYYHYIGQSTALTWEDIQEQARPVVDWLMDHTVRSKQISDYARDILDHLHGSRIYLDDVQRGEVAHLYGSFGAYRNMMMGSITIANERSVSLDTKWQELAEL